MSDYKEFFEDVGGKLVDPCAPGYHTYEDLYQAIKARLIDELAGVSDELLYPVDLRDSDHLREKKL